MFSRLSFTQAIGQLLALAIDGVVGLFTSRNRASGAGTTVPPRMVSPKHDDGRSTSLIQSPETPQEQHSVA